MSVTATPDEIVLSHPIDPWVDVVFKALFGSPAQTDLLVDFLNAVLRPETPIVGVQLADPAGERLGTADKAVTLDVKAATPAVGRSMSSSNAGATRLLRSGRFTTGARSITARSPRARATLTSPRRYRSGSSANHSGRTKGRTSTSSCERSTRAFG
jgi:PD-(D/E)XK nuclease family transposase